MTKYFISIIITVLLITEKIVACTGFYYSDGKIILAGNNEDWMNPFSKIWFLPAEENKFGRVYFGFSEGGVQGGVNDQGLFFDGFATEHLGVTLSKDKEIYVGDLVQKVMEECQTVNEVLDVFDQYNLQFMENAMFFFGDKYGNSAIIEGDVIILKEGNYQVTTNFHQSTVNPESVTCRRYKNAIKIIAEAPGVNVDLIRNILADTHQEGKYPTQYSNIYDLKNGIIYLYHFHNYENVVQINVAEELNKGKHSLDLPSLFPESYAAVKYRKDIQDEMDMRSSGRSIADLNYDKYKQYVGLYEFDPSIMPGYTMEVSCKDTSLFVEFAFLDKAEIFPESKNRFFFVGVDETLEFVFNQENEDASTQVITKMYGMEISARRIN